MVNPFFSLDPATVAGIYGGYGNQAARGYSSQLALTPELVQNGLQEIARSRQQNAQFIAQLRAEQEAKRQQAAMQGNELFANALLNAQRMAASAKESEADRNLRMSLETGRQAFDKEQGAADRSNRIMTAMIGAGGRGKKEAVTVEDILARAQTVQGAMNDPRFRDITGGMGIPADDLQRSMLEYALDVRLPTPDPLAPAKAALGRKMSGKATPADEELLIQAAPYMGGVSRAEYEDMKATPTGKALLDPISMLKKEFTAAQVAQDKAGMSSTTKRALTLIDPVYEQLSPSEKVDILSQFGIGEGDLYAYRIEKEAKKESERKNKEGWDKWKAGMWEMLVGPMPDLPPEFQQ